MVLFCLSFHLNTEAEQNFDFSHRFCGDQVSILPFQKKLLVLEDRVLSGAQSCEKLNKKKVMCFSVLRSSNLACLRA